MVFGGAELISWKTIGDRFFERRSLAEAGSSAGSAGAAGRIDLSLVIATTIQSIGSHPGTFRNQIVQREINCPVSCSAEH